MTFFDGKSTFIRRIGPDPHADGRATAAANGCPDIWELSDGNFAIIGVDGTKRFRASLPATAGCGPDERIVVLPRELFIGAKSDIPNE